MQKRGLCAEKKKKLKSEDAGDSFSDAAVFSVSDREEEFDEAQNDRKTDVGIICEEPVIYSPFRKAVNRIRTGRWGQWKI